MPALPNNVWFAFYVGDYLSRTMALTTQQHGAVVLLYCHLWVHETAPDDNRVLAGITGLDLRTWRRERPAVEHLFTIAEGVWRSPWMDERKAELHRISAERAKAAERRWGRAESSPADAKRMQNGCKTDAHASAHACKCIPVADATPVQTVCQSQSHTDTNVSVRERERGGAARVGEDAHGKLRTGAGILLSRIREIDDALPLASDDARAELLARRRTFQAALTRLQNRQLKDIGPLLQETAAKHTAKPAP